MQINLKTIKNMKITLRSLMLALTVLICSAANAQLPEGFIPCPVTDLKVKVVKADDKNNVELSFKAPTEMISEMDYTKQALAAPITRIEVLRSEGNMAEYQVLHTFESPAAGEALTYTDKDVAFGVYDYMVQVYVDEAMDWANPENVIIGELPADLDFDAFTAEADAKDPYKVILTVTLPTKNSNSQKLTMPITKVEFGEFGPMSFEPDVFYTETEADMLIPGTKIQYIIDKASDGIHTYSVQVFTATGGNYPASKEVFIGKDKPGMAQNVTATETASGIIVKWEAPTVGMNEGDMGNPANFTYTVRRGADAYDESAVVIAEDIKKLSVIDKTEFTEESRFVYLVTVKSPYGESYSAASNELTVGPAAQLPYSENFDVPLDQWGNTTTEHSTWTKETTGFFPAWQIGQNTFVGEKQVDPHSGAGLLYAFYNSWGTTNQTDAFTSGNINFSASKAPTLTFWLYDVAQGGSDVSLQIQATTDDATFATAETIAIGNATEDGWREVSVALDALGGAEKGKVRFFSKAKGANCIPVIIDDILIKEDVTAIHSLNASAASAEATFNLAGQRISTTYRGIVIKNGKKVMVK